MVVGVVSGQDTLRFRAKAFVQGLPGRKASLGGTIPDHVHDMLLSSARGITQPTWGREPLPQHIQELYDLGARTPADVHMHYGRMEHPHAPGLTVDEYGRYSQAYQAYEQHR